MPSLDKKLQRYDYLCGEDYTVIDIVIYNELMTVMTLHRRTLESREMPNMFSWFKKMSGIPEIIEIDRKFRDVLDMY